MQRYYSYSASSMFSQAGVPELFVVVVVHISSFWDTSLSENSILKAIFADISGPIFKYWHSIHRNASRQQTKTYAGHVWFFFFYFRLLHLIIFITIIIGIVRRTSNHWNPPYAAYLRWYRISNLPKSGKDTVSHS